MTTGMTIADFIRKHRNISNWIAYCQNVRGMTGFEHDRAMYDRQIENGKLELASLEVNYPGFKRSMDSIVAAVNPRLKAVMQELSA